jgi:hypothetical protein
MKHPEHLVNHYKKWKKNRSRKDTIKEASAEPLLNALQHVPPWLSVGYTSVEEIMVRQGAVPRAHIAQHAEIVPVSQITTEITTGPVDATAEGHALLHLATIAAQALYLATQAPSRKRARKYATFLAAQHHVSAGCHADCRVYI